MRFNGLVGILILTLIFTTTGAVSSPVTQVSDLKTGNLLLIPLNCGLCHLIEGEERTPYSHAGLVVQSGSKIEILEAWEKVQRVPVDSFLNRMPKGESALVLSLPIRISTKKLNQLFKKQFENAPYDSYFLWNNRDPNTGQEFLYCTEFIYKILRKFTRNLPQPKPMHYEYKRQEWLRYFYKLNPPTSPPDQLPGLSPGDFERFDGFEPIGFLRPN